MLKLNKKPLKSLSHKQLLHAEKNTPHVAGGTGTTSWTCPGSSPCQDKFE
ncbi:MULTISPECIES: hypothetical protein [unclassified Pseudoalteromonas]|nr:hypothetical protein [Pseudoalteromonas sp. XMcav2-N]MCO7190638.1 hypothetical protein [Pseudoalteromonas sp. XMcav2-N]